MKLTEEVVSTATAGEGIEGGNAIYLKDGGMAHALAKNQEPFPLKQLFSIVDGRLSTSISDIQVILSMYCGRSVFTHELPENLIGICRRKGLLIISNGEIIRTIL